MRRVFVTGANRGIGLALVQMFLDRGDRVFAGYRSRDELQQWRAQDILLQQQELVDKFTPSIEKEIDDAIQFAENSPWPTRAELLEHVY